MGLDTTHDCWHGAYTAFGRWRTKIAEAAGLPPLVLMEGFYQREIWSIAATHSFEVEQAMLGLPLKWERYAPGDPLVKLLNHSDCEGSLDAADCGPIADRLTEMLPKLDRDGGGHIGSYREKTERFIAGLRAAAAANEDVEFH